MDLGKKVLSALITEAIAWTGEGCKSVERVYWRFRRSVGWKVVNWRRNKRTTNHDWNADGQDAHAAANCEVLRSVQDLRFVIAISACWRKGGKASL